MIKHKYHYNSNVPFSLALKYLFSKYLPWHYCKLCALPSVKLICNDCMDQLDIIPKHICSKCHKLLPYRGNSNQLLCKHCESNTPYFDRIYCHFSYAKPLNKILHEFKYGGMTEYAYALGYLLYPSIIKASAHDVIIPMPLHKERQKERGFNQVEYLLHYYIVNAQNQQAKVNGSIIIRSKNTQIQANLGNTERMNNLKDAFSILKPVTNMKILLVDDVMTTGASVNEVAKLLKLNGAKEVNVCCLSRTL